MTGSNLWAKQVPTAHAPGQEFKLFVCASAEDMIGVEDLWGCLCVLACMRACTNARMRACVHACVRACVCSCVRTYVRACVRVCVCVCARVRVCVRA
jgi:hypothetical protein